jgi:hypothetical protein
MSPTHDIQWDDSQWPLLVVRFLGVPTTPQVEANLARQTAILERGERHAILYDASGMTGVGPAEQRHLQAAWLKQHDARLRELVLGVAFVIHSPVVRLAVSIVMHLRPMPSPYVMAATQGEAVAWAADRLEQDGQEAAARRVREHFALYGGRRAG